MDERYLNFSKNENSIFYSEPATIDRVADRLKIYNYTYSDWIYKVETDWIYMLNKNEQDPPDQGWKIHITSIPREAQEILYVVSKYLIINQISFKFVPTVDKLIEKNAKNANRAGSGKFITIYPHNEKIFIKLLNELQDLTKHYTNGPYILNDKQWKNSNIFFRYGGFKEMLLKKDGQYIDAIKDPKGNLVPDKRVPYYYLPDFVKEPIEIQQENKKVDSSEFLELNKYKISSTIMFNNSGGIYRATRNDTSCVLKEGRPQAGLDSEMTDGFYRVISEYRVLEILKDNPYVVNVNNYFTAWQHNYLEEDFVDGLNLDEFIAIKYPFNPSKCNPDDVKKYSENAIFIIKELIKAIKSIHSQGVAMGDLQPSNIIFSEDKHKLTLIDFEEAKNPNVKYQPGLITVGFASKKAKTFGEADWFALGKIAYFLFMPIEATNSSLAPRVDIIYDEKIETIFGNKVSKFLRKVKSEVSRHTDMDGDPIFISEFLKLPGTSLSRESINFFIEQLRNGIINNLDFKSKGLIKGDIKQYEDDISQYSINYGAFGGLMALIRSGGVTEEIKDNLNNWFLDNYAVLSSLDWAQKASFGLFDGLAGICSILYELGKKVEATSLLKKIKLSDVQESSIYSGASGIGLALLSGFILTNDNELLQMCYQAADIVKKDFLKRKTQPVRLEKAGLLDGLSGEALFLYKLGEKTKNQELKEFGIDIIDYVLKNQLKHDENKILYVEDTSRKIERAIPYLKGGSIGVAIVMMAIYKDQKSFLTEHRANILRDLISSAYCTATVQSGIIEGYAGFLILGTLINDTFEDDSLIDHILDGLNMYLFSNGINEIYFPGDTGLKCSMDLETGASGIILALAGVDTNRWYSFFPLPLAAKIF